MIPREITAEHIRLAIAQVDHTGVPPGRQPTKYHLVYLGRRYPPKYVVSLAARLAIGRELQSNEFGGGVETNKFVRALGFEIAGPSSESSPSGGVVDRPTPRSVNKPIAVDHPPGTLDCNAGGEGSHCQGQRCRACKSAVLGLLGRLYGAVEERRAFQIEPTLAGFRSSVHIQQLERIYAALRERRGFVDFVKAACLPPTDYFVPEPGFVLEYDESQHFTELREIALEEYPSSLSLGFDRDKWIRLCREFRAHDNDPPFRDEQRAWYDTLRDFLPTVAGLLPTIRVCARDHQWCAFRPDVADDVELFRQILSEGAHFWSIEVGDASNPKFGRLVMDGAWAGDANAARVLLAEVAERLASNGRLSCLSTCGAFLRFDWPAELPLRGNHEPRASDIQTLIGAAERVIWNVLTQEVVSRLGTCCDYVTIGIDTIKQKVSTTKNRISEPHAELVCLVNLRNRDVHWTGKFYPTPQQAKKILRFPDLESHFITLDCGPVMILGCHDLTVYHHRGQKVAGEWRKAIAGEFKEIAARHRPVAVIHHPHTTLKRGTWRQQWISLEAELPCVRDYLGTGAYSYLDGDWDGRDSLNDVLRATQRGEILNIVVHLAAAAAGAAPTSSPPSPGR